MYYGFIALVRRLEIADGEQELYYKYGPVNDMEWSQKELERKSDTEEIVEMIPWRVMEWREEVIVRNEEWWLHLKPKMELFWEDVEKAKRGEFVAPESTRPKKKAKVEQCQIIFTKLDENGN
jgi:predicted RNA-binding protein with EMAP domain